MKEKKKEPVLIKQAAAYNKRIVLAKKEEAVKKFKRGRGVLFFFILLCIVRMELALLLNGSIKNEEPDAFEIYMHLFDNVSSELQCFPVIKDNSDSAYPVSYENTWGAERTYGGERRHEGCDLMAQNNERGRYRVCSMTDGTVKNVGWLDQGGWRIGIESKSGTYYYYAHLDSYEKAFEPGERVVAGQILGRMGDSGYGKTPGTKGNFDVHLHVGIYLHDLNGHERAINPYWYLKRLEI